MSGAADSRGPGHGGRWHKRADLLVHEDEPFNAEPPPAALLGDGLTGVETFYSRNHGPVPDLDPAAWRLTVDGRVASPLSLGLADLRERFAEVTLTATLQCAGNRRAGFLAVRDIPGEDPWRDAATSTAAWTGVRLADVLRAAGVDGSGAEIGAHVELLAPDVSPIADPPQPYGGSVPLGKALSGEVLLAWGMNGAPLTAVHGAPVRVVVPGWIGARSVKWVERITVLDRPSANYFQAVAYRLLPADQDPATAGPHDGFSLGPIALNCAILSPAAGAQVAAGTTVVRGYALAGGGRRVARVDVSGDGGAHWVQADLGADHGRWAWRLWQASVDVAPGAVLVARTWDECGALQPRDAADLWNPKGYLNNSWPRVPIDVTG